MKVATAIILFFCVIIQNISKTIIVVNFERNREYIAANLCEKKAEPESCCEGSCQLKKQLERDDRNNGSTDNSKIKFEKSEYCDTGIKINLFYFQQNIRFSCQACENSTGIKSSPFRPPKSSIA